MQERIKSTLSKLIAYCRANEWAGYDPYDALNSRLFQAVPLLNSRIPRLVLTQGLKRSPINTRGLLSVPKTQNPKALGLFLSAFVKLSKSELPDRDELIQYMVDRLVALRSTGTSYWCWGYSFPWQTRKEVVPAGTPNLVCTMFSASALLDAYEDSRDSRCLEMARSAAEYILEKLYWTEGKEIRSFSYPLPEMRVQVHNANFLASALLCRVSTLTGDEKFVGPALEATRCSIAKQKQDGSWDYGEGTAQHWIDNFHTGFNLGALKEMQGWLQTAEFDASIAKGFEFYRTHFFREDGAPRYFHNRTYPIDIHCVAQSLITLSELQDLHESSRQLANKVFDWAMEHMWDERGFFYYRILRLMTIRTSYMRWSQAWMVLALASMVKESRSGAVKTDTNKNAGVVSTSPSAANVNA